MAKTKGFVRYNPETDTMYDVDQQTGREVVTYQGDAPMRRRADYAPAQVVEQSPVALDVAGIQQGNTLGHSYSDRATGFKIETSTLATAFAVFAAVVVTAYMWNSSTATLSGWLMWVMLMGFGTFCATWAFAYLWHAIRSPDTVTLFAMLGALNEIRQQRLEQNRRYWDDSK